MAKSINDYGGTSGDSISLAKIDGKPFTPVMVEPSDYNDGTSTTPGVKITTDETFDIDGEDVNKFHTTRIVIVQKLGSPEFRQDVQDGLRLTLKCVKKTSKNGRSFVDLEDA